MGTLLNFTFAILEGGFPNTFTIALTSIRLTSAFQRRLQIHLVKLFSFLLIFSKPAIESLAARPDDILDEILKKKTKGNKMASMSRTQQKLALQREHLLKQEQKKKEQERLRQLEQTAEVSIPFTRPTETLPQHLPPAVLKVSSCANKLI